MLIMLQMKIFIGEILLKNNPNLESDINQLIIDLDIFIMSKADLIVHIINDLYPLPLIKYSDGE